MSHMEADYILHKLQAELSVEGAQQRERAIENPSLKAASHKTKDWLRSAAKVLLRQGEVGHSLEERLA